MINPNDITTVRVGELPSSPISLTDNIAHEVGTELKRATVQELSDFLALTLGSVSGVGFRAVNIVDGQTLPVTTQQEFILVGKGTFYNQAGGSTLVCTEELNAIVSNGSYWFIGVEIPIDYTLTGLTQFIRAGFTNTFPSENTIYETLLNYYTKTEVDGFISNLSKVKTIRFNGSGQTYNLPNGATAIKSWINDAVQHLEQTGFETDLNTFTQDGIKVTFKKTITTNQRIYIDYQLSIPIKIFNNTFNSIFG